MDEQLKELIKAQLQFHTTPQRYNPSAEFRNQPNIDSKLELTPLKGKDVYGDLDFRPLRSEPTNELGVTLDENIRSNPYAAKRLLQKDLAEQRQRLESDEYQYGQDAQETLTELETNRAGYGNPMAQQIAFMQGQNKAVDTGVAKLQLDYAERDLNTRTENDDKYYQLRGGKKSAWYEDMGQQVVDTPIRDYLPYMGMSKSAIVDVVDKKAKGDKLSQSEQALLSAYDLKQRTQQYVEADGGATTAAAIGSGLPGSVKFLGEIALTGGSGLANGITKGAIKLGAKAVAKAIGKTMGKAAIIEAARTPFVSSFYDGINQKTLDQYSIYRGPDGQIMAELTNPTTALERIYGSYAETFTETYSEQFGNVIGVGWVGKVAPKLFGNKLGGIVGKLSLEGKEGLAASFTRGLQKHLNWNGTINEFFEEKFGDAIRPLLTGNTESWDNFFDKRQNAITLGSVVTMGAAMHVTQAPLIVADEVRSGKAKKEERNHLKAITSPIIKEGMLTAMSSPTIETRAQALQNIDWGVASQDDVLHAVDYFIKRTEREVMGGAIEAQVDDAKVVAQMDDAVQWYEMFSNKENGKLMLVEDGRGNKYYLRGGTLENDTPDNIRNVCNITTGQNEQISVAELKLVEQTDFGSIVNAMSEQLAQTTQQSVVTADLDEIVEDAQQAGVNPDNAIAAYNGIDLTNIEGSDVVLADGRQVHIDSATTDKSGYQATYQDPNTGDEQQIVVKVADIDSMADNVSNVAIEKLQPQPQQQTETTIDDAYIEQIIAAAQNKAIPAPQTELNAQTWEREFGSDGVVQTPVGEVKVGDNQYLKLIRNKREAQFGMIHPTLTDPDFIIQEDSKSDDGQYDRDSTYLFIKTFNVGSQKYRNFVSVTISKQSKEVVVSNHLLENRQVLKKLKEGKLLYLSTRLDVSGQTPLEQQPNADTGALSNDKDTNNAPDNQTIPLTKDGQKDYDAMDAPMLAQQMQQELGGEEAIVSMRGAIKEIDKQIAAVSKRRSTSLNTITKNRLEINRLTARKAVIENAVELLGGDVADVVASKVERKTLKQQMRELGDYVSVEDYMLRDIASGQKFSWRDKTGTKGLASELGFVGNIAEMRSRIGLLHNDGPTPEQYAEDIRGNVTTGEVPGLDSVDDTSLRNMVLDILLGLKSSADAASKAIELHRAGNQDELMAEYLEIQSEIDADEQAMYDASVDETVVELTAQDLADVDMLFTEDYVSLQNQNTENGYDQNDTRADSGSETEAISNSQRDISGSRDNDRASLGADETQNRDSEQSEQGVKLAPDIRFSDAKAKAARIEKLRNAKIEKGALISGLPVMISTGADNNTPNGFKPKGGEPQPSYTESKDKRLISILKDNAPKIDANVEVEEQLQKLSRKFGVDVEVVNNVRDVPDEIKNATRSRRFKGLYQKSTGKVYFVLSELTSKDDATATFLHEVVAHKGVDGLMGRENADKFYTSVFNSLPKREQERLLKKYNGNKVVAGDETVASIAEGGVEPNIAKRVLAAVRRFFRSVLHLPLNISNNDIRYILWKSKNNLEKAATVGDAMNMIKRDNELRYQLFSPQSNIDKLVNATPVEITGTEITPSDDIKEYRRNALEYAKTIRGTYVNEDTGNEITLARRAIEEVLHHDASKVPHLQSIAAIPLIIAKSTYIGSEANTDTKNKADVFHYYVCGLNIAKTKYTVKMVVAEIDGNRYYDHAITEVEKSNLVDLIKIPSLNQDKKSTLSKIKDKRLISILQAILVQNNDVRFFENNNQLTSPNEVFNSDLERYITGTIKANQYLRVGHPQGVLKQILPNLPIIVRQRVITKGLYKKHSIAVDALKNLPKYLSEPIFIFKRDGNSIGILIDQVDELNRNICVAIQMSVTTQDGGKFVEVNNISTIHGRDNINIIKPIVENGTLIWVDKQKGLTYLSSAQMNGQEIDQSDLISATNVIKDFDNSTILVQDDDVRLSEVQNAPYNALDSRGNALKRGATVQQENWQDATVRVKLMQQDIKARGGNVNVTNDVHTALNLVDSRANVSMDKYHRGYINPIINHIKEIGLPYQTVSDYLLAKCSIEREDSGTKALAKDDDGEWTRQYVTKLITDFEDKVSVENVDKLWELVRSANNRLLDIAVNSGRMSRQQVRDILDKGWQYYVPLRGKDFDFEKKPNLSDIYEYLHPSSASTYAATRANLNLQAKGRSSKAVDPLATMQYMANLEIIYGERNKALQTLLRLVEDNKGMTDMFTVDDEWFVKVGKEWVVATEAPSEQAKAESWAAGRKIVELERKLRRAEMMPDKAKIESIEKQIAQHRELITVHRQPTMVDREYKGVTKSQLDEHDIMVMRNGIIYNVHIADSTVANAITGANMRNAFNNVFGNKAFSTGTRIMSALSTSKNMAFIPANFVRDMQHAAMYNLIDSQGNFTGYMKHAFTSFKVIDRALRDKAQPLTVGELEGLDVTKSTDRELLIKKYGSKRVDDTLYDLFLENGGQTGYVHLDDVKKYSKRIERKLRRATSDNTLSKGLDGINTGLDYMATITENATRYATFMGQIEKGADVVSAARYAKNITVNFNTKGKYSRGLGALYMFFNASVQGVDNMYKLTVNNKGRAALAIASLAAAGYAAQILQTIMLEAMGDDDWAISDYERKVNLIVPFGDSYIKIPIPILFRPAWNIGIAAYDYSNDNIEASDAMSNVLGSAFSSVSPVDVDTENPSKALWPSLIKPIAEIKVYNTNFTGRPINRRPFLSSQEGLVPDSELGQKNAYQWTKNLTKALNRLGGGNEFTPAGMRSDGSINKILNWLDISPSTIEHILSSFTGGVGGEINKTAHLITDDEKKIRNIPILNRFWGEPYKVSPASQYSKIARQVELQNSVYQKSIANGTTNSWADDTEQFATQANKVAQQYRQIRTTKKQIKELKEAMENMTEGTPEFEQMRGEIENRQREFINWYNNDRKY